MFVDNCALLTNFMWKKSIEHMRLVLSPEEQEQFGSNDFYYLSTIYFLGHPNFTQISEELGVTKPAVSILARKLQKLDLVKKVQSKEDKRVFYLELTQKGLDLVHGNKKFYDDLEAGLVRLLDDEEIVKKMHYIVEEIVSNVKNHGFM